jgi:hypothetical protein
VAIPLTSGSAPAPAALIDRDRILIVEPREGDPGYGIVVYEQFPRCPMCRETRWEHVEWWPFSQLLDGVALLSGTRSQRRRLHAPSSPTAEESIRYLRPGQAAPALER